MLKCKIYTHTLRPAPLPIHPALSSPLPPHPVPPPFSPTHNLCPRPVPLPRHPLAPTPDPALCLPSGPSSLQLLIGLAFPVNTNAISAFAAIGVCSKLEPILQSVYVTWNPTYCQFQAPSFVGTSGSQLGGGKMVVFTCWDALNENRFSAQVGGFVFCKILGDSSEAGRWSSAPAATRLMRIASLHWWLTVHSWAMIACFAEASLTAWRGAGAGTEGGVYLLART